MKHAILILFASTLFLNAFLLFSVQPMFAKMLLPLLGGSPSVWTTCMLFFQSALLAGYFYAHITVRLLGPRSQPLFHLVIVALPLLLLPIGVTPNAPLGSDTEPMSWLLTTATVSVGLPFFVLATSAPLLQRWFSATRHGAASDPYVLYGASNTGSFIALILYPTLFEPTLSLRNQTTVWAMGYGLAALLTCACAAMVWRGSGPFESQIPNARVMAAAPLNGSRRLRWIALSFVPSSLMLAVTAYLSTDVAAVPLLWTVPLALYLLTFIVTFSGSAQRSIAASARLLPYPLLVVGLLLVADVTLPSLWLMLAIHLAAFTALAMLCHGALAADRPPPEHLTEFYLLLSAGGALGGIFNTLVAPRVFTDIAEYPLVLALGCLLLGLGDRIQALGRRFSLWYRPVGAGVLVAFGLTIERWGRVESQYVLVLLIAAMVVCFSVSRDPARFGAALLLVFLADAVFDGSGRGPVLYAQRTFFGVYRVTTDSTRRFVTLFHGTTIHGRQHVDAPHPEPLTYYHRDSPIGEVFRTRAEQRTKSVGVVGLGVGSLASYARPGQQWMFYEIDPEVVRIARDTRFFRFLSACGTGCGVLIGDARLTLGMHTAMHDVIVLDAFSSDAIPVHLMTREALALYLSRLSPDGTVAFHISNRHLDLQPVIARLAREHALVGRVRFDARPNDDANGRTSSQWVILARTGEALGSLWTDPMWSTVVADTEPAWTDNFSNIWNVIRHRAGLRRITQFIPGVPWRSE